MRTLTLILLTLSSVGCTNPLEVALQDLFCGGPCPTTPPATHRFGAVTVTGVLRTAGQPAGDVEIGLRWVGEGGETLDSNTRSDASGRYLIEETTRCLVYVWVQPPDGQPVKDVAVLTKCGYHIVDHAF